MEWNQSEALGCAKAQDSCVLQQVDWATDLRRFPRNNEQTAAKRCICSTLCFEKQLHIFKDLPFQCTATRHNVGSMLPWGLLLMSLSGNRKVIWFVYWARHLTLTTPGALAVALHGGDRCHWWMDGWMRCCIVKHFGQKRKIKSSPRLWITPPTPPSLT